MSNQIKDGTGEGFLAKVNQHNALYTHSISGPLLYHKSRAGKAFLISSGRMNITTAGGRVMHLNLTEPANNFCFHDVLWEWSGHDGYCEVDMYVGDTTPTTNIVAGVNGNLNFSSSMTVGLTTTLWNGGGDGMTGHSPGNLMGSWIAMYGQQSWPMHGSFILSPSTKLSFNAMASSAGVFTITIIGYLQDPDYEF